MSSALLDVCSALCNNEGMSTREALTCRRTPAIDNYDRLPSTSRLALSVERVVGSDDLFVAVKADADTNGYAIARPC